MKKKQVALMGIMKTAEAEGGLFKETENIKPFQIVFSWSLLKHLISSR